LINEYGDLDTLLARVGEIKQPKRREALVENAEKIRISRELVTLKADTPLDVTLGELEIRLPEPQTIMGHHGPCTSRNLATASRFPQGDATGAGRTACLRPCRLRLHPRHGGAGPLDPAHPRRGPCRRGYRNHQP